MDYECNLVGVTTNIHGKINDSLVATYNDFFRSIIGPDYVLGDTGFAAVDYIVPGFKPSHIAATKDPLEKEAKQIFDAVTRREQVEIERLNNFIKKHKSVDKDCAFHHRSERLILCVFILAGLYNFKKSIGYYQP